MAGEAFGLIKFAFPELGGVQGNRDYHIPPPMGQFWRSSADQHAGQENLEPNVPSVFVTMDDVPNQTVRQCRRTGKIEVQIDIGAVRTLERAGKVALVGQAATAAKGSFNVSNLARAGRTNEAFFNGGVVTAADLTNLRVKKPQARIKPRFQQHCWPFMTGNRWG